MDSKLPLRIIQFKNERNCETLKVSLTAKLMDSRSLTQGQHNENQQSLAKQDFPEHAIDFQNKVGVCVCVWTETKIRKQP